MKITFLGTSHGVPEAHRKCSCIMVECGENIYFFDMGTPVIEELQRMGKSVAAVKGIFITHMHGDHTNGLLQFINLITWYFMDSNPVVALPDTDVVKAINNWLSINIHGEYKQPEYRKTEAGMVFDDGVLKVTAIPTQHCPGSHAYVLEAEGKTVLYTGDMQNPLCDFPYPGKALDLLICESAHFPATDYLPVLEKLDLKKLCITHYSPRSMRSLYEMVELMKERKLPMVIATDDLQIEV